MRVELIINLSFLSLCPLCLWGKSPSLHRSPFNIALLTDTRALTANHTADSISLIDIECGQVLDEKQCGRKPSAIACSPDGRFGAVSNLWSGTVSLFDVQESSLKA